MLRPVTMYLEPNWDHTFGVVGIAVKNDGRAALEPDAAYLSFVGTVSTQRPSNNGWERSPDHNIAGWTTFETRFGRLSVSPGHSVSIPTFWGTPIPGSRTKAKVTVVYGSKKATAEFSLRR